MYRYVTKTFYYHLPPNRWLFFSILEHSKFTQVLSLDVVFYLLSSGELYDKVITENSSLELPKSAGI